jgi:tetratricopeptide (TPR) repeat protein
LSHARHPRAVRALPALLAVIGLTVMLTGCRTIRAVQFQPATALVLSAEQAAERAANGWKLYQQQPRTVTRVTQAAQLLGEAAEALPEDFDTQWQAAAAFAWLAESQAPVATRREAAERGIGVARRAHELKPERVEGHYWYALNVGLLADLDRSYGLDAVKEMERALRRAIEIEPRHDYAGPLRVMAILHLRAPGPPISIGSKRRALGLIEQAVELFPDYPENHLYHAEALRDISRVTEARRALRRVLDAKPWPDRQAESEQWRQTAKKMLQQIKQ